MKQVKDIIAECIRETVNEPVYNCVHCSIWIHMDDSIRNNVWDSVIYFIINTVESGIK